MRFSTILWSLTHEKAILIKRFLLLSFLLTRFSNVIEGLSSSPVSFGDRGDNPFDQSTTNQLLTFHNHHHRNNHHQHQHRHRHHHGSKSTINHQHNQPQSLSKQLIDQDQQLINSELDSIISSSRSSTDGINKLITSDGDKPCASCASLDEQLFVKLKLEAIKNQILSKLHLDTQPNVTSELSDSMVIDALLESKSIQLKKGDVSSPLISSTTHQSSIISSLSSSSLTSSTVSKSHVGFNQPPQSSQSHLGKSQSNSYSKHQSTDKLNESSESTDDDYYGTTSEIISFPEPGTESGFALESKAETQT